MRRRGATMRAAPPARSRQADATHKTASIRAIDAVFFV
ncbi:hypothetical protein BURCENBC7_AP7434 [Burkholderia cenocepacia BC7]|jgi:hypothetical protein|nr:hypothetical protein BURCENK562V_C0922 [Burkholderia cenocepacia K56-2Valvano]ERI30288.1 hypothetical protein BURCENBC7_AP7434 [Burkholderia cenocepacia BC7]CDN60690.1 hypothetical protein I35_2167 [Burkholderia cenocepacia H111]